MRRHLSPSATGPVGEPAERRDEAGVTAPSLVVMLSVVAVAMAGISLLATRDDSTNKLAPVGQPAPVTSTTQTVAPTPTPTPTPKVVVRGEVVVEVYNTSSIKKLAARTAEQASVLGWQVVGTDNWQGSVPAPTIYYGPRLEDAARLLGKDLGVRRIRPAADPMKPDRVTVILDRTYAER